MELFEAYMECRKKKRFTHNALKFEIDYEHLLVKLCDEINQGLYQPKPSIAFIVEKPVKREIFAADFRDRIVHHWLVNKLNPLFEKTFIYDSYACRKNKGTHFGIKRIDRFIRQCSRQYSRDCYILKLDIKGFFMHIDKNLLMNKLDEFISRKYLDDDKLLVLEICRIIINNNPTQNVIIKGNKNNWDGLPADKSLFHSPKNCGLPIGNLTSQVFANFYMNDFDHYVKNTLGIRYYGRYVDDFVIVHENKDFLKTLIPKLSDFLLSKLRLTLHPRKIYLQKYDKGVKFLGVIIKPFRLYIANRTKGSFYAAIERQNEIAGEHRPTKEEQKYFQSSLNSYLGIMKHYKTYTLRKRMLFKYLSAWWWNHVSLKGGYLKFVLKERMCNGNRK
ncbi:MAG: reverse transcriptase/maturase family protein [Bacteroidales bacterium]|nr:reverse transcriptase/maturase family protein [Bacteroidales bacterium]